MKELLYHNATVYLQGLRIIFHIRTKSMTQKDKC